MKKDGDGGVCEECGDILNEEGNCEKCEDYLESLIDGATNAI